MLVDSVTGQLVDSVSGQRWLTVLVGSVGQQCWDSTSGQCWDSVSGMCT